MESTFAKSFSIIYPPGPLPFPSSALCSVATFSKSCCFWSQGDSNWEDFFFSIKAKLQDQQSIRSLKKNKIITKAVQLLQEIVLSGKKVSKLRWVALSVGGK